MKYFLCYLAEKHHRFCFDKIYRQDRKRLIIDRIPILILNFIQKYLPDYRRYLKYQSNARYERTKKTCERYTSQWN